MSESIKILYNGTLKALLVILHDFPEFLAAYHASLVDVIPSSCVQLRNVVLSAFPRHMHLPDPFTPNLKVDRLPEITQPPLVLSDVAAALQRNNLRTETDAFLRSRRAEFLREVRSRLLLSPAEMPHAGTC